MTVLQAAAFPSRPPGSSSLSPVGELIVSTYRKNYIKIHEHPQPDALAPTEHSGCFRTLPLPHA